MTAIILVASVQFEGIGTRWGLVWVPLALIGFALLVWTYRGIYLRSGRPLAWGLLALRSIGLAMLFLMLAKPTWTRAREEVEPLRLALVVDTSRSMSLPEASGGTRYARALEAMTLLRQSLGRPTPEGRLEIDLFDVTGASLRELPGQPVAESTDLTRAIRRTLTQMQGRPLAGVLLISDGADTTGRPSFMDFDEVRVPVHTLGFTGAVEIDLAIRSPTMPRKVIVHNELTVQVPVSKKGAPPVEATVKLRRGKEVLATRKVKLPAGDNEQVVTLTVQPDRPGSFEWTTEVEANVAEADTLNNAVHLPLEVVKDPIRVLYIEGFLRNEFTFLVRHFGEKDPDVTLVAEPRRTLPEGGPQRLSESVLDEKALGKVDVVILGDMESAYLTPGQTRTLLKWLEGKDHSLLVLGGYESFGPRGFRTSPLAEILPVVFSTAAEPQSEKPFTLRLTDMGRQHPIFTLGPDRARSDKLWQEAPPLEGMPLVARARPGAEVLAVHPEVMLEGSPAVAIAVQRAPGGGQVMVVCPDTTWKWSRYPRILGQDDTLYGRFWSQAIRFLAGRALDDARPILSVRTEKPVFEPRSKVTLRVTRQGRPGSDTGPTQFSVEVTDPKGSSIPGLVPVVGAANPDEAVVEFYPDQAGRYEVQAALKADGKVIANQATELRVQGEDLELADRRIRTDHMKALAEATGGLYAEIDAISTFTDRLPRGQKRSVRTHRSEYWDSPWLFAVFLGAVTGEWFLRRRNQLV